MSQSIFRPEWRTQSRRKRRFYARYMGWLERVGFTIVTLLLAAFVGTFFYEVDEWVSAEDVEIQIEGPPGGEFLVVRPKLEGKSIANADLGQIAELTNLRIHAPGDTLLRAEMGGDVAISRALAGTAVKDAVETSLKGRSVLVRGDIPLKIEGIGDVEIEARLKTGASSQNAALAFDPNPAFKLRGRVVEGQPILSGQLGDLPPDVQKAAAAALQSRLAGKTLDVNGRPQDVAAVIDPRFVVRLRAQGKGVADGALPAASLKRTYEAVVRLENVPAHLFGRVVAAREQGKAVTARVQVRTGAKPIAYFLLRRS